LPRRNKGYFGQKVTKTLFGNSPIKDKEIEPRSRSTKSISLFSVQLLSSATVPFWTKSDKNAIRQQSLTRFVSFS